MTRAAPLDLALTAVDLALQQSGRARCRASEMEGGASTRRFFRVLPAEGPTLVAMYVPLPSQEVAKARQARGSGAFIEVQALLRGVGVSVPTILGHFPEHDVLLVEDLGDDTLAAYLARHPSSAEELYSRAVRDLAHAQARLDPLPSGSAIFERAFDPELLRWEVDHFREWALLGRGSVLSADERVVFDQAADFLAETIAAWPRGFVHRDYQSRNLMVREGDLGRRLTWIDFQDAMLGPRVYDLVALLMDSYQSFDRLFIEERLREFSQERGLGTERETLLRLVYEFDLVTVQRKLKDAGRFVFLERVNGNSSFLQYVEPTIERARTALRRVAATAEPLRRLEQLLQQVLD